jgi:hypothetical protein
MLFLALCLVAAASLGCTIQSAFAATTHPFLGDITLSGIQPGQAAQPEGVDAQGNLIVWISGRAVVAKFDPNGNPVSFTGLGTNILDGAGGSNCPAVPSDCDRAATNGFGNPSGAPLRGDMAAPPAVSGSRSTSSIPLVYTKARSMRIRSYPTPMEGTLARAHRTFLLVRGHGHQASRCHRRGCC